MEQPISAKKSNASSKSHGSSEQADSRPVEFELPPGTDFDPPPRRTNPDLFIQLCEESLPGVMSRADFWERRQADRCHAEFDLLQPSRVPVSYPAKFLDELLRCA